MTDEPDPHDEPHLPPPTLWPIGFAIGVAVALVGLIINPLYLSTIGAVIAVVFGVLWARGATAELRGRPVEVEPERRGPAADAAVEHGEPGRRFRAASSSRARPSGSAA